EGNSMTARLSPVLGVVGLAALSGLAVWSHPSSAGARDDAYANLPSSVVLTGVVRDFKAANESGGHPDFERTPTAGFAHYIGQVADTLDSEGLPQFASVGYKISSEWKDASGRNRIKNRSYISAKPGDINGAASSSTGGSLTTSANFAKWYRNTPGVN